MTKIESTDLYNFFINEKKTCKEISKIYGCSASWIHHKLKEFGISVSERRLKQKFGKLKVIKRGKTDKYGHPYWICKCDCGNVVEIVGSALSTTKRAKIKPNTMSCGCLKIGKNSVLYTGYKEISGSFWDSIKRNSDSRNLEFDITIEYIWNLFEKQKRRCAISGKDIKFSIKTKKSERTASLDRIDSSKGYIKNNVQWIHKDINKMKSNFDQDYFLSLCKQITINRGNNH